MDLTLIFQKLLQSSYCLDTLYDRTGEIGVQLFSDKDIIMGMYSTDIAPLDLNRLNNRLLEIKYSNDTITRLSTGMTVPSLHQS